MGVNAQSGVENFDKKILKLKTKEHIEDFLQKEGSQLSKENMVQVLEQISALYQKDVISDYWDSLKEHCFK